MKKMIVFYFLLFSTIGFSQEKNENRTQTGDAPDKVRGSFQKDNAESSNAKWDMRNNQWHVNYNDNTGKSSDAYYDNGGNRLETHTHLSRKDVPDNVDHAINTKYGFNGSYDAERIDKPNYRTIYKIKYQRKNRERTLFLDEHAKRRHFHEHYM
jgi:hypothetical protein